MSFRLWLAVAAMLLMSVGVASAERVKDIVDIQGVRGNPLWGFGVVIGLNGTGDDSTASRQALSNILRREGLVLKASDMSSKNIASVIVTAELGPWSRRGSSVDVTVSAIANASSLQGGTLLMTELKGADGNVYAVVQKPIIIGGFSAAGDKSSISKGHVTVGTIPDGATVEREETATFIENGQLTLLLRNPDFATAERIAQVVNKFQADSATAIDAGTVRVKASVGTGGKAGASPADRKAAADAEATALVRKIGELEVKVDSPAVVVINERTGTIIVGENVRISGVAISHGNLSVVVEEHEQVSQPSPFSRTGTTEKTNDTQIRVAEERSALNVLPSGASVAELAKALNAMGLTPRDIIAIFEALKSAGALQAQLKVM